MDFSHVLLVPSDDIQTSAVSHSDQLAVEVDSSIVSCSVASRSDVYHDLAATTLFDCSSHPDNSSLAIGCEDLNFVQMEVITVSELNLNTVPTDWFFAFHSEHLLSSSSIGNSSADFVSNLHKRTSDSLTTAVTSVPDSDLCHHSSSTSEVSHPPLTITFVGVLSSSSIDWVSNVLFSFSID